MGVASVSPTLTLRWQQGDGACSRGRSRRSPRCRSARSRSASGDRRRTRARRRSRTGEVVQALQPGAAHRPRRRLRRRPADRLQPARPVAARAGRCRSCATRAPRGPAELNQASGLEQPRGRLPPRAATSTALADPARRRPVPRRLELAAWKNERAHRRSAARLARRPAGPHRRRGGARGRVTPSWPPSVDTAVAAPVALAVLGAGTPLEGARVGGGTTVSDRPRAKRVAPPSVAGLRNVPAAARLVVGGGVARTERSVVPTTSPAVTRPARVPRGERHPARRARAGPARRDERDARPAPRRAVRRCAPARSRCSPSPNAAHDVGTRERPELALTRLPDPGRAARSRRRRARRPAGHRGGRRAGARRGRAASSWRRPASAYPPCRSPAGTPARPSPTSAGTPRSRSTPPCTSTAAPSRAATTATAPAGRRPPSWSTAPPPSPRGSSSRSESSWSSFDDPAADSGRRLVLGLDGATQAAGADGLPLPPTVLVSGSRTFLGYRVTATGGAGRGHGRERRRLAPGGRARRAPATPADVVGTLAARGFDAALGTAASGPGQVGCAGRRRWTACPGAARQHDNAQEGCTEEDDGEEDDAKKTTAEEARKKTARRRRHEEAARRRRPKKTTHEEDRLTEEASLTWWSAARSSCTASSSRP